jgi:hypothetical protein
LIDPAAKVASIKGSGTPMPGEPERQERQDALFGSLLRVLYLLDVKDTPLVLRLPNSLGADMTAAFLNDTQAEILRRLSEIETNSSLAAIYTLKYDYTLRIL